MKVVIFAPWDTEGQLDYNHSLCQSLGERCEVILVTGKNFLKEVIIHKNYTVQPLLRGILFRKKIKILRIIKLFNYLIFLVRFYFFLQRTKPDIIHYQFLVLPIIDRYYLTLLKKQYMIVMTIHDVMTHTNHTYTNILLKDSYRTFSKLIVHSDQTKKEIMVLTGRSSKDIRIIPHGPYSFMFNNWPPVSQSNAREIIGFHGKHLLVMIGSILPYKGHETAIELIAILRNELNCDVSLIISGSSRGESIDYLSKKIHKYGLQESVLIHNKFLSFSEMRDLMCASDAGLMPYKEITTSGPVHMFQTYGIPIICTNVDGILDVIKENVNGILIDRNELNESAAKIYNTLNNKHTLTKLQGNALYYRDNSELSWEKIAQYTLDLYQNNNDRDRHYW